MSWFGDNISNITGNLSGQLSSVANTAASFTRDVLAEGTEEVSDHTTELKVAQDRIKELEVFVFGQKAENERLQLLNGEMSEKAEASELQINTISKQYRTVLQEKEDELKILKQQQHAMQDLHHNMMSASVTNPTSGLSNSTSTSSLSSSAIAADDRDFVDVISSQHEINRLSNEVSRLAAECQHWKQMAHINSSQPHFQMGGDSLDSADDTAQLKAKMKELERQLSREIDESQHQMSTLQNAHSQKMSTLGKKHKAEIEDYQIRIEELEQSLSSETSSIASTPSTVIRVGSVADEPLQDQDYITQVMQLQESLSTAQQTVAQMENTTQGLELELDALRHSDSQRGQVVIALHQQVEELQQEKEKLVQDNDILQYVKKDLAGKLDIEQEMSKRLKMELEEEMKLEKELLEKQRMEEVDLLQQRIKEQEDELGCLREDNDQVSEGKNSIATLQTASDNAWDQSADILSDMGNSDHQELTAEFVECLESENQMLRSKVSHLESVEDTLTKQCASLTEDKDQCQKTIANLNKRVQSLKQGLKDPDTGSERTLELAVDSETESAARHRLPSPILRPLSPSAASTDSDLTASSIEKQTPRGGYLTSEGTIESDLPDGRLSHLESSADNVSFDGEYDDSIMFGGIKERYPEAANALKVQIEQFELVRADWEMEKEALEEVVVRMREQLKEKDRDLQDLTAERGLLELDTQQKEELNAAVELMDNKIDALEADKKALHEDKMLILQEKDALALRIKQLESDHQQKVTKLQALTDQRERLTMQLAGQEESINNLSLEVESYKNQLHEREASLLDVSHDRSRLEEELQVKEASLMEVNQDKSQLEDELQELDNQHQEAINQVISSKDDLSKIVVNLKEEVSSLSQQLDEKESALNDSQCVKDDLNSELEQLKEQLQKQDNHEQSTELEKTVPEDQQQKISMLESKLQDILQSNKVLDNRKSELEVEINELSTKTASIEVDLERVRQQSSNMIDVDEKSRLEDVIATLQQDLTAAKEQQEKDCQELQEVLAQKDSELATAGKQQDNLNRTLSDKEEQLQDLSHIHQQISKELSDLQLDAEALVAEKEALILDLKHSERAIEDQKQRFENSIQELSDSRELDTSNLQDEYEKMILLKNEQDADLSQFKSKVDDLEDQLSQSKEMLDSTLDNHRQLTDMVMEKDADIKSLAEENSHLFKAVEDGKTKLKEQLEEVRRVEGIDSLLDELKDEKAALAKRIKELEDAGNHWQDAESKTLSLITEMEAELGQFKESLQEKDQEVVRLNLVIEEQQTSLSEIQNQYSKQFEELDLSRSLLAESTTNLAALRDSMQDKENQILEINKELDDVKETFSNEQSSKHEADVSIVEKEAELSELRCEVDQLSTELNNTNHSFLEKLEQKDEEIKNLQNRVTQSNQDVEVQQRKSNDIQDKMDRIALEKDQKISELKCKVSGDQDVRTNGTVKESPIIVTDVELTQTMVSNLHPAMSDTEKQFEKMVQERDRDIKVLKDQNQSLLDLLEDKSQSTFGNSSLSDMHRLQMQVRTHTSERNQMMSVMNDKTRECSNLKNEVHQLVKTITAQKTALEKALADNRDIQQQSTQGPRKDMQKEALQKLSRLIQDKDLEMEALKMKNESLLQVLQQSAAPNDSTQISKVLQEREQLQKENKVMKEERDQLVVSIHQKHHESLTYYEEVQRLSGLINTENQKHLEMQQKYNSVYADLDDKEKGICEMKVELDDMDKSLGVLQKDLDQRNESVSFLEGRLLDLNETVGSLESRNVELEGLVNDKDLKQNQEDGLSLRVIEEKDAEILDLKQQLQAMTLMTLDQADDQEVIKVVDASLQNAPPPQYATPTIVPPQVDPVVLEVKDKEISTLKDQIENLNRMILEKETSFKKGNADLEKHHIDVASLKQEVDIQNQNLLQKDAALQLRTHKQQELENIVKSQESELQSLKHTNQTVMVQMEGYKQQFQSLKTENQTLQHAVHNKDGENRSLQDMSNRLAVQIQEKEFEIGALKEKSATLTSIVQQKDVGDQGELQRVLKETEAMQRQAQLFQHERDQALLALQRHEAEAKSQDGQIQSLKQKEQQLERELDRLRNHLLEMEDGYTQEALSAEEREKELRTRLGQVEERARYSSSAVQNASKEATAQIESLLDQLNSVSTEKDQALLLLAASQEQAQQYATSLNNLQMVLEQFQQEKDSAIASEVEMYQIRAQEKDKVAEQLLKTNIVLQEKLAATTEALEGASRLSEQLDKKEEHIEQIRIENQAKDQQIEEFQKHFAKITDVQESKIDKPLVKNLFLGYFHAPKSKRNDVLKVMAGLLNLTPDEISQIANEGQPAPGWLGSLWGRRAASTSTPPASPRHKSAFDSSFTESFVKFLEEESCPKPHMRLPIEEMTSNKPRNATAFNPFSAPIPQQSPFMQASPTAAKGPGVPLPVAAPHTLATVVAPVAVRSSTPVLDGGSGPGRGSPARSGRGSPARSAAVLKDILQ